MATEYDEDLTPLTGADLRSARLHRGVGQGELERLLGVRKSTVRYHESRSKNPLASPYRELAARMRDEEDWPTDLRAWFEQMARLASARRPRRLDIVDLETDIELSETGKAFRTQTRLIVRARDSDVRGVPIGRSPIDEDETNALIMYDGGTPGRQKLDRWTQEHYIRFEAPLRTGQAHVVTYVFSPPAQLHEYAVWSTEEWRVRRCTLLLWVPLGLRESLRAARLEPDALSSRSPGRQPVLHSSANGLIIVGPTRPAIGERTGVRWWIE